MDSVSGKLAGVPFGRDAIASPAHCVLENRADTGAPSACEVSPERCETALEWWKKTVIYEVYPRSFQSTTGASTGDIRGVASRLDYLASLGVGAIWLTPVFASPMADNGYDVADYYRIDPSFGTMEDMEALIAEAGERGIRVVLDMVVNHTSDQNRWFAESSAGREGEYADWYIWRDPADDGGAPNNWRSIFGGSAWEYVAARGQYYLHTFLPQQPDLNWENPAVRQALRDVVRFWMGKGAGGFRIDAVTYIKKPFGLPDGEPEADGMCPIHRATANTPGILDLLREFREGTVAGTDCFMVGEANGVPASDLGKWVGADGVFDMLLEFNHLDLDGHDASWTDTHGWKLADLKDAISGSEANTAQGGWYPVFFENHDQPRAVSQFFPEGADRVLAAKALATVQFGLRGTPFVYQGQELGLANVAWPSIDCYDDVQSHDRYRRAVEQGSSAAGALAAVQRFSRDNARTPMQWDSSKNAGFTSGDATWLPVHGDFAVQNAEAEGADPGSVLNYFRKLAGLRAGNPVLLAGAYEEIDHANNRVFAFVRSYGGRKVLVMANFSTEGASLGQAASLLEGAQLLVSNYPDGHRPTDGLRPLEACIFSLR